MSAPHFRANSTVSTSASSQKSSLNQVSPVSSAQDRGGGVGEDAGAAAPVGIGAGVAVAVGMGGGVVVTVGSSTTAVGLGTIRVVDTRVGPTGAAATGIPGGESLTTDGGGGATPPVGETAG